MIVAGFKYGKLIAIEPTGVKGKRGEEWLFKCECGVKEKRFAGIIRQTVKRGHEPMCVYCREKTWHEARIRGNKSRAHKEDSYGTGD